MNAFTYTLGTSAWRCVEKRSLYTMIGIYADYIRLDFTKRMLISKGSSELLVQRNRWMLDEDVQRM